MRPPPHQLMDTSFPTIFTADCIKIYLGLWRIEKSVSAMFLLLICFVSWQLFMRPDCVLAFD
jgi:hypothetical protein